MGDMGVNYEFGSHVLVNSENLTWLKNEVETNQFNLVNNVDVCYIDPPYNTGNDKNSVSGFIYDDNRGVVWLSFMEERLKFAYTLLKVTGVLIVSIDDNEVHYLRVLLDELFGRKNFVAQITVDGGANKNNSRFFSVTHEYMLVYAKNVRVLNKSGVSWRQRREGVTLLLSEYQKLKGEGLSFGEITVELKKWVKGQPLSPRLKKFVNADSKGLYTYADLSVPGHRYEYTVLHPATLKMVKPPSRGWGVSEEKFWLLEQNNMIIWGEDETIQPLKKLYLTDEKDQLMKSVLSYPSRSSTHLLENILGERKTFNNPKNLQLMKDILDYVVPDDGVVLDFFAGTGTTGQAILELNEETKSKRKFVLVTNNENNIFDKVTLPRLMKVHSEIGSQVPIDVWEE